MGGTLDFFKKRNQEPLNDDINLALREIAGWPLHTQDSTHTRNRHRTVLVYRDSMGRVTHSVEQIDEDEYEQHNESKGR